MSCGNGTSIKECSGISRGVHEKPPLSDLSDERSFVPTPATAGHHRSVRYQRAIRYGQNLRGGIRQVSVAAPGGQFP